MICYPPQRLRGQKEGKNDREVDDRKGAETEYHHAEELDLGSGFSRATDTGMHERGEPESGADRAWRGWQRIPQHMKQKSTQEATKVERNNQ